MTVGKEPRMNDLTTLFSMITATRPASAWPSLEKCQTLGALVIAMRPSLIVELGVWTGDSLIPMCMALKHVGRGKAIAIDPWQAAASVEGQSDADATWWGKVDHEHALQMFRARLARLELEETVGILRQRSDEVDPASLGVIDILHVDANHGDAAIRDVDRFAPQVPVGGVLVMDDLDWNGGSVRRAHARAVELGFVDRYPLGTGCVMIRARA